MLSPLGNTALGDYDASPINRDFDVPNLIVSRTGNVIRIDCPNVSTRPVFIRRALSEKGQLKFFTSAKRTDFPLFDNVSTGDKPHYQGAFSAFNFTGHYFINKHATR